MQFDEKYWESAYEQLDENGYHICSLCGRSEYIRKEGNVSKSDPKSLKYLKIRFVDIDGHPKMACVECEPNRPEPRYDRKMVDRLTKNMFGL